MEKKMTQKYILNRIEYFERRIKETTGSTRQAYIKGLRIMTQEFTTRGGEVQKKTTNRHRTYLSEVI